MITPAPTHRSQQIAHYNIGYSCIISFVAAMGGLLFGYDWVVIGGAKPFFEPYFQIQNDPSASGWANSCALLGCLAGALLAGGLSDRWGRKRLLIVSGLLFVVTSLGNALAENFGIFIAWRILGGVGIGLASNLSPMYIAEIAPAQMRGRLVSINQLTIVIGVLAAQLVNWALGHNLPTGATAEFIRDSWYGEYCWRWMFALTAVPALLFFLGMFFVPESPRWLVRRNRVEQAKDILMRIGGARYADGEAREVQATLATEDTQRVRFSELWAPRMRQVLVLGIGLAVFQQWCGINVIFNYAEEIFKAAGYDIASVLSNIAWTGSVNLAFTVVAFGVVDRLGRRPMMLFGAAGLAVIYSVMGACYFGGVTGLPVLALVLAAIACYAMTLAPVTWVVISEIFPNRIRGAAMAVAVAALWLACFILTFTFPMLNKILGPAGTFWLYAVICVLGTIFIYWKLPETKGKTLEELEQELVD
jgi:sugar porter (SP) family MFS transporter